LFRRFHAFGEGQTAEHLQGLEIAGGAGKAAFEGHAAEGAVLEEERK
jgi:hypothetical protein